MDRVCNRPEVLPLIFERFKLIDGKLHRLAWDSGRYERVVCKKSTDYLSVDISGNRVLIHNIVAVLSSGGPIPDGMVCDHIDGDKHNNDESNIRIVSPTVNNLNVSTCNKRSKSKEISITQKRPGKWRVKFKLHRKEIDVGHFNSIDDAIKARDEAFLRLAPDRYAAMHRHGTL